MPHRLSYDGRGVVVFGLCRLSFLLNYETIMKDETIMKLGFA